MAVVPKILAFAGSARKDSYNKKLAQIIAAAAHGAGAEVTLIELEDYPLPLMDEDCEAEHGLPANARKLKDLMLSHQGFLIACPEYNSSITPLLKNTIDWTSRPVPGEPPLACFAGKWAVVVSASPGALGGLRGLVHVRSILDNIGTQVLAGSISIPQAMHAFADDGSLKDAPKQAAVEKLAVELVAILRKVLA